MNKIRVGIDLDGVLWDLTKYWIDEYNKVTGESINVDDIKSYNIDKYVKYPEMLWHILENGVLWDKMELYPHVYRVINTLKHNRYIEIKIVTSTYYKIVTPKINKLLELLPMLDRNDIIITDDKSWVDVDVLIDDYEQNLINSNAKIKVLINQPYNKHVNSYDYTYRAYDLLDAYIYILNGGIDLFEC